VTGGISARERPGVTSYPPSRIEAKARARDCLNVVKLAG
jgi:hypothetical protein